MTTATFQSALRSFCRRTPFQPFFVELISGERVRVKHPEAIALRGDLIVFVAGLQRHQLFDSASVAQILDIG